MLFLIKYHESRAGMGDMFGSPYLDGGGGGVITPSLLCGLWVAGAGPAGGMDSRLKEGLIARTT